MASIAELRRAVLGRFFPACGAFLLSVLTLIGFSDPHSIHSSEILGSSFMLGMMTLGFGVALFLGRQRLASVPRLGFRSAAAGLLSPLVLSVASVFAQGASLGTIGVLSLTVGVLSGGGLMASALLRRTPPVTLEDPNVTQALKSLEDELSGRELGAGVSETLTPTNAVKTHVRTSGSL